MPRDADLQFVRAQGDNVGAVGPATSISLTPVNVENVLPTGNEPSGRCKKIVTCPLSGSATSRSARPSPFQVAPGGARGT
jgi:hypothetical protein